MKKILIVEDDSAVRQNIQELLDAEGYDVRVAKNGREAIDVVAEVMPDLVLCDVMMPDLDGHGLLKELSKDIHTATIPFVFLTARADPSDLREAMNMGADDYITKPFTRDVLLNAISKRLDKSGKLGEKYEGHIDELRTNIAVSLPHELRTPLTGIMGFSEYLLDNLDSTSKEEMREYLTHIYNSGKRLNRLVENYITYSELQIKRFNPNLKLAPKGKPLSAMEYVVQIANTVAIDYEREDDLDFALVDAAISVAERDFQKISEELIGNAFRFSRKGQKVHISSRLTGEFIEITIRDHGSGISPQKVRTMGGFVQIDRDKNEQQGSGLGFTIARQLVELMGGSVTIESKENFGTTVSFTLPARKTLG
jgi:two-component system, sensor histidine kinase and response regulator